MLSNLKSPQAFPYAWASSWGEDQYGLWICLDYYNVEVVFRWIEPGAFKMGSPKYEKGRYLDEGYHQVTLSKGFWLAETTVTQNLWEAVMGKKPSHFEGERLPVDSVSWHDSQNFLEKMSKYHHDLELRLPWEAEWEYACRANSEAAFNFGNEISLNEVNYNGLWKYEDSSVNSALKRTVDVKSYRCNAWGLYEMHGNVREWCQDYWQESLGEEVVIDPVCEVPDSESANRVVRGGSWNDRGRDVRSAFRFSSLPDRHDDLFGLRISLV